MTARPKLPAHVGRAIAALLACAAAAATSACSPNPADEPASFTSVASSTAEFPTPESETRKSEALSEANHSERNPADFEVQDAYHEMYSLYFRETMSWCVYKPTEEYFGCGVDLSGTLPPYEGSTSQLGRDPDYVFFEDATGFAAAVNESGHSPLDGSFLETGESVTIGDYRFIEGEDGTARVIRDGKWFEVAPSGQYSSHRFDPKGQSRATGAHPAQKAQTVSDAEKYADLVAPGDHFCTTFPYNGGVYVVSARDGETCIGIDLLEEFVNTPITVPGQTDLYYDYGGSVWHCGYGGSGAGYCEPQGREGGVVGRGTPIR